MEPITVGWMMGTLLSGWIGNRGDFWLCKGFNALQKRISENFDEPTNHHVQRAIRKSYLSAVLLAVEYLRKQKKWYNTDPVWDNLDGIKDYINKQIGDTQKENSTVPRSALDTEYREMLFTKEGSLATDRLDELIQNLQCSIIQELENHWSITVTPDLKVCICGGWKDGDKDMDFYKLTCAFFMQELKDNPELSTFIQTEYLDHISADLGDLAPKMTNLESLMQGYYELYKDLLTQINELLATVQKMDQKLDNLPKETAKLVVESINAGVITAQALTVSDQYQQYLASLKQCKKDTKSLRSQIIALQLTINLGKNKSLQPTLSKLQEELKDQNRKHGILEQKLNEFISNIIKLSKQLNDTKYLDSERLKAARFLFAVGNYQELLDILNEKDIDRDLKLYREQGKALASELTIKGQAIVLNKNEGWFAEADKLYSKALSVSEDYYTTSNYAFFLHEHRQVHQAIIVYERVLRHCSDDAERAMILNNLGLLQNAKNEYGPADASYGQALQIFRQLAADNPQNYLPYVGHTLNNLGILQSDKNEYGPAEASYQQALQIRRQLAAVNPQTYLPDVANTLNNLGVLQMDKSEYGPAEASYRQALQIFRQLSAVNPQTYLPYVAGTLNNLGLLQVAKNEYDPAGASYKEALQISRQLGAVNPQTYMHYVAEILNNLGLLQVAENEYGPAEASYQEALQIRRQLAAANPQTYMPYVADTLNNLGILLKAQNEYGTAEACYQEALQIRSQLAADNPQVYSMPYANTCINLALLYRYNKVDKQQSINFAAKALDASTPFTPQIPQATKLKETALGILKYWEEN